LVLFSIGALAGALGTALQIDELLSQTVGGRFDKFAWHKGARRSIANNKTDSVSMVILLKASKTRLGLCYLKW
jgi:hypothetical protein